MMLVIDYRYRVFPELSQYRWIFSEEYPTGFMALSVWYGGGGEGWSGEDRERSFVAPASKANVRLMYDAKGRLLFHKISDKEAKIDLRKVMYVHSENETCTLCLHDKRIICNADPNIQVNDTIKFDYAKKKIIDYAKVGVGNFVMVTGGRHKGRVGVIRKMGVKEHNKMKTIGLIRIEDDLGREFATSLDHVFVIGKGRPWISLPDNDHDRKIVYPNRSKQNQVDLKQNQVDFDRKIVYPNRSKQNQVDFDRKVVYPNRSKQNQVDFDRKLRKSKERKNRKY
ncbi:hypothetical protein FNV43_RR03504 [Rhamnella rubrinervis]|uniref:KOW domain-containing protein n=1 Tax=Rhamnella rubrinervis TaxID=2594499 RepID=A0A8K0HII8_9ROSA|nr:hypothetical protein FNV43_RR03504 [Rhamnella rubrinervis]